MADVRTSPGATSARRTPTTVGGAEKGDRISASNIAPSAVLSPASAGLALQAFELYREQLWALGDHVERWLAKACNEGGALPDDAPLQEWRLMEVLLDLLRSDRPADDLRCAMGQHLLREATHD